MKKFLKYCASAFRHFIVKNKSLVDRRLTPIFFLENCLCSFDFEFKFRFVWIFTSYILSLTGIWIYRLFFNRLLNFRFDLRLDLDRFFRYYGFGIHRLYRFSRLHGRFFRGFLLDGRFNRLLENAVEGPGGRPPVREGKIFYRFRQTPAVVRFEIV